MSDLVPADQIEQIVGIRRHRQAHFGRAVSAEHWYRAYGDDASVASSELCSLAPLRIMQEGEVLR